MLKAITNLIAIAVLTAFQLAVGTDIWAQVTCGTEAGQTPFTITASVTTNYNGQSISCNGANDGAATVSVIGGVGPFSYLWVGGQQSSFTQNYNNLGAGTYTVIVNDLGQGITCVDNVQLSEPAQLAVLFFIETPPSCAGSCDGTATPIVIGGVGPYDYAWGNGETGFTAFNLCEGFTELTVTDANNCVLVLQYEAELNETVVNLTTVDVFCAGEATGEATVTPVGGNGGPYTVVWSTGDTGNSVTGLSAGLYSVDVTDLAGCTISENFEILENAVVEAFIDDTTDLQCENVADGSITASANGGTPPYTFSWTGPNGYTGNGETINGLDAGTYTLVVSDVNGCEATTNAELTAPPAIVINANINDASCNGASDGDVGLIVTGGNGGYTYSWTGPNGFAVSFQNLTNVAAGSYTVEVTDLLGCVGTAVFEVEEPLVIDLDATVVDVLCNGDATGSIEVTPMGGTPPYTYAWTGPNAFTGDAALINNLVAGTYVLTVTDDNDCTVEVDYDVLEPNAITIDAVVDGISCNGATDGTITATVSGGVEPYTYAWTGPNAFTGDAAQINNLVAGTYSLTVTDNTGCEEQLTVEVDEPQPIAVVPDITEPSCGGLDDGAIALTLSGGTAPYTVAWTGPNGFTADTEDITGLFAGIYSATVTDLNGCEALIDIEVVEPTPLTAAATIVDVLCNGEATGSIAIVPSGGTPNYSVAWEGPNGFISTANPLISQPAGSYTLTLTDANGCELVETFEIAQSDAIDASIDVLPVTCNGAEDATLTAIANGGAGPYTYAWTGPNGSSTDPVVTNAAPGTWNLTVTDANLCDVVVSVEVDEPTPLVLNPTLSEPDCTGNATGAINLDVSSGVEPYTVSWTGPNGFTSDQTVLTNLEAGTYSVTVTDQLGCEGLLSVELTEPDPLEAAIAVDEVSCTGVNDGSVTVLITGGASPYDILWSGPDGFAATTESLPAVGPGIYTLDVIDDNGCTLTETVEVLQVEGFDLVIALTNVECNGDDTGAITVDILTGTGPFTTAWSGPNGYVNNFQNITDLFAGDYTLALTDATGCASDTTVTITQNTVIALGVNAIEPSCNQNDGALEVVISGGVGAYNIFWYDLSNGNTLVGTTAVLSNIGSGNYFVEVFDALGCSESNSVVLSDNLGDITAVVNDVTCQQAGDGSIEVTVTGGADPYTYAWTGPNGFASADPFIENLAPGDYTVEVTDADGCVLFGAYIVDEAEPFAIAIDVTEILCNGDANGSLSAAAEGGTAPYTFAWTGPNGFTSDQAAIADLAPGTYTIAIIDFVGCESVETVELTEPAVLELTLNGSDVNCNATDDGSIQAVLTGGTMPYTLTWNGPNGFTSDQADLANLEAGTYTLTAIDANGCAVNGEVTISQLTAIDLDLVVTTIDCNGDDTGAIEVAINSGIAPYVSAWTSDNGFVSNDLNIANLFAGEYTLTLSDATGCETVVSATVTEGDLLAIGVNQTQPSCNASNGALEVVISGGTGNYSIIWYDLSNGNAVVGNDAVLDNIASGNYFVEVFDELGCTESTSIVLSDNAGDLSADITDVNCAGTNDGAIALTVTGATEPFIFAWTGPDGYTSADQNPSALAPGDYTVEVTDADGCTLFGVYTVNEGSSVNLDVAITDITCGGANDGALAATASNGTAPYTFAWSGPDGFSSDQASINGLAAGTYTLTATDVNGCEATLDVEIIEPTALAIVLDGTDISCTATDDGAIDAAITGGTEPYTIVWSGPDGFSSDQTQLSNLVAGTYEITVTDAAGCILSQEITLNQVTGIDLNITVTDIDCGGEDTGAIDVEILSGEAPYTTAWTGPNGFVNNFEDLSNLFAGEYTLTVTDADGCSTETTVTVNENAPIVLGINATEPGCNQADGALEVVITGGSGNYLITWLDLSNGNVVIGNGPVVSNIPSGSYFVEVVDELGCVASTSVPLSDDAGDIEPTITGVSCNGAHDGSISVIVVGGTEPYIYVWTGPDGFTSDQADITGLAPGEYNLSVEDALGCALFGVYEITEPDALTVSVDATDIACFGETNGTLIASLLGGTPDYSYAWTGPDGFASDQPQLADLAAGCYDLTVTDANGCEAIVQQCINEPSLLEVEATPTGIVCSGEATGSIEVLPSGGTGNYAYAWSGPDGFESTDQNLFDLLAGTYTLTLTDDGLCSLEIEVEVTENSAVEASVTTTEPQCVGATNGSIEIAISGGSAPYTINWFAANGDYLGDQLLLENLASGTYTYTVIDAFSCQIEGEVTLNDAPGITIDSQVNPPNCEGSADGQITTTVSGGTEPYIYVWSGPNGFTADTDAITNLEPGTYQLTVTDANGCQGEAEFIINEPAALVLTLDEVIDSPCLSDSDGAVAITVSGGNEPYTFVWTGTDGFTSTDEDLANLFAGTYNLTVTDAGGCDATLSDIVVDFLGDVTLSPSADEELCFGEDLVLEGTNSGATESFWSDEVGNEVANGDVFTPILEPGNYTFIYFAIDGGCVKTDTVEVMVNGLPLADAGDDQLVFPQGQTTLGGDPTTEDGNLMVWAPSEFLNADDEANPQTTPLSADTDFFLEVTDANGCVARDSVTVSVIPEVNPPSGFTPNGDGMNDLWIIDNAELYPSMIVEIYNRWGELLFRADEGYQTPWDGTYNGGQVPVGTYYFVILINEPLYQATIDGPITILR